MPSVDLDRCSHDEVWNLAAAHIDACASMGRAPDDWDGVVAAAPYAPVELTRSFVEYQNVYAAAAYEQVVPLSMVLYHDRRPAAVWPLSLVRSSGGWRLGSNVGAVLPPLFAAGLPERSRKRLIQQCFAVLAELTSLCGLTHWDGEHSVAAAGTDLWHRLAMEAGATVRVGHELYVDLSLEMKALRANLRDSYKALVTRGLRLWQTEVVQRPGRDLFEEFRAFHIQVAGRETRPVETWRLQEAAVARGEGFLVVLRDDAGAMVGCGLFHHTRHEGLYGVGVYDRSLFDQPLGHVVQFKAMEQMQALGLRWYKLGYRPYPGNGDQASAKELSIARFKEGFSTHTFLRLHIHCPARQQGGEQRSQRD